MRSLLSIALWGFARFGISDPCEYLKNELASLNQPVMTREIIDEEMMDLCFQAEPIISNNYRGEHIDHYQRFLELLALLPITDREKFIVNEQVNVVFTYFMPTEEEARSSVNTITLWAFRHENKDYHVIETGWGDDDQLNFAFFAKDHSELLLMGSN